MFQGFRFPSFSWPPKTSLSLSLSLSLRTMRHNKHSTETSEFLDVGAWGFRRLCLCFRVDFELGFGLCFCFGMGFGICVCVSVWFRVGFRVLFAFQVCVSGVGFGLSLRFRLVVLNLLVSMWVAYISALFWFFWSSFLLIFAHISDLFVFLVFLIWFRSTFFFGLRPPSLTS